MIDRSGSIVSNQPPGVDNFQLVKSFLTSIVESPSLTIGRRLDRVALVTFETTAEIIFDLSSRTTLDQVRRGIALMRQPYGETNTPAAIDVALRVQFNYGYTYI